MKDSITLRHPLILTTLFSLAVVAYHIGNFQNDSFYQPSSLWEPTVIKVYVNLKPVLEWHTVKGKVSERFQAVDFSSQWISRWGYALSFLGRRVPDFLFLGPKDPVQRLYVREEIPFQYPAMRKRIQEGFVHQIQEAIRFFESHGITLIIVPVPTKISIEREQLPKVLPADTIWNAGWTTKEMRQGEEDPQLVYRTLVEAAPNHVVDLFTLYQKYKELSPNEELFVPGDTHWSSLGINLAAMGVIMKLRQRGWKIKKPKPHFVKYREPDFKLDLIRPLQLPQSYLTRAPAFHWEEPLYEISPLIEGSSQGRIYIAGTCYSKRLSKTTFGFGRILGKALRRTPMDASVVMGGAKGAFARMRAQQWALFSGDVLVWEFPIREPMSREEKITRPFIVRKETP